MLRATLAPGRLGQVIRRADALERKFAIRSALEPLAITARHEQGQPDLGRGEFIEDADLETALAQCIAESQLAGPWVLDVVCDESDSGS